MGLRRVAPVALAFAMLLCGTAHAGEFSVKALTLPVTVGPNDDVTCTVAADLYTPKDASAAHPDPAILTTNGFGGSKADQADFAREYAARGYVVLSYSGLGFGGSTCKITLDDRDYDGKAGSQLVTYLASLPAVLEDKPGDPRVGMIGGSYGGQIQFAVAGIDPRVDTIVPQITWNDLAYSLAPNNTSLSRGVSYDTPGVGKVIWTAGFFAIGVAQGLAAAKDDPGRVAPCPNFADQACASLAAVAATGGPSDATIAFLRHASVASFVDKITIPTLLAQGETDTLFDLQESVATYRSLKAQGTPVKLLWRSAGHSGGTVPGESAYEDATYRAWFDHYLKGDPAAPSLDFTFFRDWVAHPDSDATVAYARAPSYPVGREVTSSLSADGTLVDDAAKVKAGALSFVTPTAGGPTGYSEISILDPGYRPVDAPGTFASFTGPPLSRDTDVVGVPTLDFRLSADAQKQLSPAGSATELALFLRLEDVAPDGSVTLPKKLISPIRIADPSQPVHAELPGIVHRFAAGHRMRLVIAGGDAAYRGNNVAAPVSILTDPSRPGVLRVPVLRDGDTTPVVAAATPAAASRSCASRRTLVVHLRRRYRARVRSARIVVDGATVARVRRGRATISLKGRAKGRTTVRIVMRLRSGRSVTDVRRYRTCTRRGTT